MSFPPSIGNQEFVIYSLDPGVSYIGYTITYDKDTEAIPDFKTKSVFERIDTT
jgi:hypothetical protein